MIDNTVETGIDDSVHPMAFLLSEELNLPQVGDIRKGIIITHRNNEILIDIGAKSEGVIPASEIQKMDAEARAYLEEGKQVPVYIVNIEDQQGNVIVSYLQAVEQQDWLTAEKLKETQDVYDAKVLGKNKGGVLVRLGQLRGFIPKSQLTRESAALLDTTPGELMKQTLRTKVLEVDQTQTRLIMSEKAATKEIRAARKEALLDKLEEGDTCNGRVVSLTNFGAFIDIGGLQGLVHLSEMSWKRINTASDLLEVGDEVEVVVLTIDKERGRLALSLKRLQPDPWDEIEELYQEGQLVEAVITKVVKFGAFARLQDEYGLEGLIHISELSEEHVDHPSQVVQPSQEVMVRIIRVNREQRQLGLSIKQVVSDRFVESDLERLTTLQQ
ncbi:MAG: S1 RNA-binding domain-containing protein [Chloroflexi bacterium]|nr:S1 RNA-binding domain-containing protein [Chloroflexota bacterium]